MMDFIPSMAYACSLVPYLPSESCWRARSVTNLVFVLYSFVSLQLDVFALQDFLTKMTNL